jgi:hypothetical protein
MKMLMICFNCYTTLSKPLCPNAVFVTGVEISHVFIMTYIVVCRRGNKHIMNRIQNLNKILLRLNDLERRIVKLEMRFVRNTTNEDKYKNEIKSNKI